MTLLLVKMEVASVPVAGPLEALEGTGIAATTRNDGDESTNLVAYVCRNGYLKVQTRKNVNISLSDSSPFSPGVQIARANGRPTGLAAVSGPGSATIFFVVDKKIPYWSVPRTKNCVDAVNGASFLLRSPHILPGYRSRRP